MRIGVVGAGAIGLTFASALSRAHDVLVLARDAETAATLARDGITVVDADTETRATVNATADPAAFAGRDAVIVAVKSYATSDALVPLRGVLQPHALVASVQNGLGNVEAARAVLPGTRVVAGATTQGAIRLGRAYVRRIASGVTVFAGEETSAPTSADLAAAFRQARLEAHVEHDAEALLWRKLVVNAAINPACALAARTNGDAADDPDLAPLARALAEEAAAVARAEGAPVDEPWEVVKAAARATAANRNSMLQDLEAGRRTEIDAISGAVASRARAHGVAVPYTDAVLRLVRARERA